jgi:methylase of polypeptide subunit release factors
LRPLPLRLGTPEQFAACRQLLRAVGYTEEALLARYDLKALSDLRARRTRAESIEDALELLTQLFVDGAHVTRSQVGSLLPDGALDVLAALGLVRANAHNTELWAAPVMLYPRSGVFLTSDRPKALDTDEVQEVDDIVFSALTDNTERFLELLPDEQCDVFLDLGTGTGVAALVAARIARHVWAVDVTERATRIAEFNRRLNGVTNVTVLRGDLFSPVSDLRFDRIVIHPPYVPAFQQALIYQDGGLDGQDITRRAVSQLPRHLCPGGRFYCLTVGFDSDNAPFEQTVRRWLQPDDEGFDVAFALRYSISVRFMAQGVAIKSSNSMRDAARLEEAFERLKIREFVYGDIIIQRHAAPRPGFTVRRQRAPGSGRAVLDWLLRWETELAAQGPEWLLGMRPRASPHVELLATHRMANGELTPTAYRLQTNHPFSMEAKATPWMGVLVARCDGTATGREHYAYLRKLDAFSDSVTPADFARLLGQLVSGGFIVIPGYEPPR